MSLTTATQADERNPQIVVVALAVAGLFALAAFGAREAGWRQAALAGVGFFAGFALHRASFGFASSWRRMMFDARGRGVRAQILMIALAIAVFFPALEGGAIFGQPAAGFVMPVGLALCVGAFLFGVGMQLAGGCGSGTLYTAGGGSLRMIAALGAFVLGSLVATADPLSWREWPDIGAHSLVEALGATKSLAIAFAILSAAYAGAYGFERARHGAVEPLASTRGERGLLWGPWPALAGAAALAFVNIATLALAGRPWGITSGFALWGAKIAAAAGLDVASWPYWRDEAALARSLFADATSVMNFAIMLGAAAAAGLAAVFSPRVDVAARSLAAAVVGGLIMGLGARLSTGCNIGGFFSGVASGSLHGLVWLAFAVPGALIGARLRPWFGLSL